MKLNPPNYTHLPQSIETTLQAKKMEESGQNKTFPIKSPNQIFLKLHSGT